ncbi:MAG: glycoside hydrolase family 2 protein [Ruminococcaceae bacterium]|nr:glycoside hydrolase family 2 protein [Oscillospiraceae bacterium]
MSREKILFDRDWYFHRGALETALPNRKGTAYMSAKTERVKLGPACRHYVIPSNFSAQKVHLSENWSKVHLPHDYLLNDIPDQKYNEALGFVDHDGAWYLKRFTLEKSDRGRRLTLLFEGVTGHCTVWLNGCLLKHNFCGYNSFEVDISDVADFDQENALAVFVAPYYYEGWWYEGAGIYRHVWLNKCEKVSIDLWGVYAKPVPQKDGSWTVETELTVRNDDDAPRRVSAMGEITDAAGKRVCATAFKGGLVAPREKRTFKAAFIVAAPALWSPDEPNLYTVHTTLHAGAKEIDQNDVRIGFRSFTMDPDKGLFINGKPYKIKGYCAHEVCGFGGKAVADNIQRHRVKLMKESGANAYRCSHYPQAESLMDALDENGFIVMNETRWFESTEESLAQLEMVIKRDRNRPSVFFWSLGNEEPHHTTDVGRRIFKTMKAFARKLDDRPMITAVTHDPENATVYEDCDLLGINYKWDHYEAVHAKYPNKAILSSECGATGTTRGWYHAADPARGVLSAYDTTINNAFRSREATWRFIMEREWLMGGYHWDFNEHRGEAAWPRVCSVSGTVDLFWRKKDAFYQHQSFWTDTPMVHLLPHWNHEGLEGEPIRVVAYTNQPRVELFLNGESLGSVGGLQWGHAEWQVPYAAGRLEAVAFDEKGDKTAQTVRQTAGKPVRLALKLETDDLKANGSDMALIGVTVLDAAGREVPHAEPTVRFVVSGAGTLCGTGAANTDHVPVSCPDRKLWQGQGAVAVRAGLEPGECCVIAEAEGLGSAILRFDFS